MTMKEWLWGCLGWTKIEQGVVTLWRRGGSHEQKMQDLDRLQRLSDAVKEGKVTITTDYGGNE